MSMPIGQYLIEVGVAITALFAIFRNSKSLRVDAIYLICMFILWKDWWAVMFAHDVFEKMYKSGQLNSEFTMGAWETLSFYMGTNLIVFIFLVLIAVISVSGIRNAGEPNAIIGSILESTRSQRITVIVILSALVLFRELWITWLPRQIFGSPVPFLDYSKEAVSGSEAIVSFVDFRPYVTYVALALLLTICVRGFWSGEARKSSTAESL